MISENLSKLAGNRDLITTEELTTIFSCKPQTIRKNFSEKKQYLGIKPLKIGKRLLWKITDVAKVVNGEKL